MREWNIVCRDKDMMSTPPSANIADEVLYAEENVRYSLFCLFLILLITSEQILTTAEYRYHYLLTISE